MTPENKTRLRWLVVGLILAGMVVGYAWASYATRVRDRELRAKVAHQKEVLDLIGALEGERKRHPEDVAPALAGDAATARGAGAGPVAAVRVITREVPFAVPGDCPVEPPLAGSGAGPSSNPTAAPQPVTVSVEQQGLIFAQGDGVIRWKGVTFATLRRGEWSQRQELLEDAVQTEFAVDPALEKAWARYAAGLPWQAEVRVGLTFPDPGLALGGSWYGKRRRWGLWADVAASQRQTASYDSYYETTIYGQAVTVSGQGGVTWRIGPK